MTLQILLDIPPSLIARMAMPFSFRLTPRVAQPFKSFSSSYLMRSRQVSTKPDLSAPAAAQPNILSTYLVSPTTLNNALKQHASNKIATSPQVIPLCAAWFMPNDAEGRTGKQVFANSRIPGARFFDIDAVCDRDSPYPHMLPTPEVFAEAMSKLGIHKKDSVVVYDSAELGIFSAPRVAWTLKAFGHSDVHVLNNFKLWVDQGLPLEKDEIQNKIEPSQYPIPTLDQSKIITYDDLRKQIELQGAKAAQENKDPALFTILDARSPGRWNGSEPEPRKGISSGHMSKSINIPFSEVLNGRTKAFLDAEELKVYFECKNVDAKNPIISSCGTGVTACVIDAALTEAGYPQEGRKVYDGSWTEWATRLKDTKEEDKLIVKGNS